MKDIVWTLQVTLTKKGGGGNVVRKSLKLPFPPSAGIEIEDSAWKEPRKIAALSFNTGGEGFFLALGIDHCEDKAELARTVQMYESHGWKALV